MPTNKQKIHLRLAPESIHGTYGINYYFQTEGGIPELRSGGGGDMLISPDWKYIRDSTFTTPLNIVVL